MQKTSEELIEPAMQILMRAGDARLYAKQALEAVQRQDFTQAGTLLASAQEEITGAHAAQTKIIQEEAKGVRYAYSMLFNHAQDTLMTINSEIELTAVLIDTFRAYSDLLKKGGA